MDDDRDLDVLIEEHGRLHRDIDAAKASPETTTPEEIEVLKDRLREMIHRFREATAGLRLSTNDPAKGFVQ